MCKVNDLGQPERLSVCRCASQRQPLAKAERRDPISVRIGTVRGRNDFDRCLRTKPAPERMTMKIKRELWRAPREKPKTRGAAPRAPPPEQRSMSSPGEAPLAPCDSLWSEFIEERDGLVLTAVPTCSRHAPRPLSQRARAEELDGSVFTCFSHGTSSLRLAHSANLATELHPFPLTFCLGPSCLSISAPLAPSNLATVSFRSES